MRTVNDRGLGTRVTRSAPLRSSAHGTERPPQPTSQTLPHAGSRSAARAAPHGCVLSPPMTVQRWPHRGQDLSMRTPQGHPGNVAIPRCSAPSWPSGGCQDRPGASPHPARRTIRRQGLLIARDQGDAARPRGPAVIPQPSDRIAHRKRRGSAGGRPRASTHWPTKGSSQSRV